ncbi:MAG: 5-formyltetrahydrofolate cyclo-ligase [Xanthobacteraceae bacterium]|nr:MAG: 5-formyltetrahydrofolate cyclo-ligase [Xanthobacteraceae bacterium]
MPAGPTKDDLRRAALIRRDAVSGDARAAAAEAVAVRPFPVSVTAGLVVAGYYPIRSEFDPRPLMRRLARRGAKLALPRMERRGAPLVFHAWNERAALVAGPFGILEPAADAPVCGPDIVLVPLAAFDRAGHRLGYGAGFYDRTLLDARAHKSVTAIGLAFAAQEVETVLAGPHDERLDVILTEREVIDLRTA